MTVTVAGVALVPARDGDRIGGAEIAVGDGDASRRPRSRFSACSRDHEIRLRQRRRSPGHGALREKESGRLSLVLE
jgi:hypothetical protein